jgi:hypothetical protein
MKNYRLRAAVIETPKGNYFVETRRPSQNGSRVGTSHTTIIEVV